jgi:hypothetical protein
VADIKSKLYSHEGYTEREPFKLGLVISDPCLNNALKMGENKDAYARTGPNSLSYWARTSAFNDALQTNKNGKLLQRFQTRGSRLWSSHKELYKRLGSDRSEIRLLYLLARDTSPVPPPLVSCKLKHSFLKDNPKFMALSYCWGDPRITRTILVNGQQKEVTTNLADALEHLQRENETVVLWVDALCNNQDDEEEMNEQLGNMHTIYRQASLVIGWLGRDENDSNLAMTMLDSLGKETLLQMNRNGGYKPDWQQIVSKMLSKGTWSAVEAESKLVSISSLVSRDWWTRVWILQEVELAKDVLMVCGDLGIPFGVLRMGFEAIYDFGNHTGLGHAHSEIAKMVRRCIGALESPPKLLTDANPQRLRNSAERKPLARRLELSNGFKATQANDHIYALLALVDDAEQLGIRVGKSKSSSVAVFREAAQGLLTIQHKLYILSWCWPIEDEEKEKDLQGIPSWVPDWSSRFPSPIWLRTGPDAVDGFFASGSPTPKPILRVDGDILTIRGAVFDTVGTVGPPREQQEMGESGLFKPSNRIKEAITLINSNRGMYSSGEQFEDALWRTLVADVETIFHPDYQTVVQRATKDLRSGYMAMSNRYNPPGNPSEVSEKRLRDSESYRKCMARICIGRQLFMTSKGYLGVGQERVKADDKICIFLGAAVPFLLREMKDSNGFYQLIGECYIHGIMDGELFKNGEPPMVDFPIR